YSQLRILFRKYGVEIRSVTEYFENSPSGRFLENIIANVAQFDNEQRAERCTNGMREAMREGRYVWMAPIGYSNDAKYNGKPTIQPNETAPLVKRSFELVATATRPIDEVWRQMVREGLKVKSGKAISRPHFHDMLRNPTYTGWIEKFGERNRGAFQGV